MPRERKFSPRSLLPALIVMPLALAERTQAACTPEPPADNSVATCTGATTDQSGTNGYGTAGLANNSITVEAGASVTGTDNGVIFFTGNATNLGTITGTNFKGLFVVGTAGVRNSGAISGGSVGVYINNGILSNVSGATITGGSVGVLFEDGGLTSTTQAGVANAGTITGSDFGVQFQEINNPRLGGGVGNSGTISAIGPNGIAISAVTTVTVTNESTGVITGQHQGIVAASAQVENAGTIQGVSGGAIVAGTVDVANSGTIAAPAAAAISTGDGDAKVTNSGTISGRVSAVSAAALADITNAAGGVMQATSVPGQSAFTIHGFDVLLNNAGTVQTGGSANLNNAVNAANNATIENSGNMLASGNGSAAVFALGAVDVRKNSGLMRQDGDGGAVIVGGEIAKVNNSGSIQTTAANGIAIFSPGGGTGGFADVTNSGTISATAAGGVAISAGITGGNNGSVVNVNNLRTGVISADVQAIASNTGSADVTNEGTIQTNGDNGRAINTSTTARVSNSGTIQSSGTNSAAIFGNGLITVTNGGSGTISAGVLGVGSALNEVKVDNAGTIQATAADGVAIKAATTATVRNSGMVQSLGAGGFSISAFTANVDNAGTIQAPGGFGIVANNATVTNFGPGVITGEQVAILAATAFVNNVGTILATDFGGIGISAATINVSNFGTISGGFAGVSATGAANVINSGTISGRQGITANGNGGVGSTITNSGTIAGSEGTAIKLSPAADTLTLLPGSKIIGAIDMGGGADTINIVNSAPILSRVSSFFKFLSANALNLINFTGVINASAVTVDTGGMPAVQTGDSVATLDPTAFGRADRVLMNFTGGISSLVQGRLGGTAANGSAMQVVSFAPTGASGRTNEAFAAISGMSAMGSALGYAKERPLTHSFTYADAPYNVWTSGFGGTSTQKGDNTMLRSVASAGAGVIGVDRQLRPDLLIGAFAGGGASRLSVELNSQSIDTDYVTGGFYGRFDWISHFLDFTLQGGATTNKSKRLVLNNSGPAGSETATASYDSWYISPEIAYGRRYYFADGYTLTPVGRIRYLAGTLDGYNEAGSAQNLVVGRRTLHDLEERAELELSRITGVKVGSLSTSVHGGVIALQRLGTPTINTVLIGQNLSFTTPGKASTAGVVAGAGFDFRATDRMSLFGAFEATLMSDHTRTASAKAGLKFAF